jgi:hypothetical protein
VSAADDLLAQIAPQIREMARAEADHATAGATKVALAQIQAAKTQAIAAAKDAVWKAGLIGGAVGLVGGILILKFLWPKALA